MSHVHLLGWSSARRRRPPLLAYRHPCSPPSAYPTGTPAHHRRSVPPARRYAWSSSPPLDGLLCAPPPTGCRCKPSPDGSRLRWCQPVTAPFSKVVPVLCRSSLSLALPRALVSRPFLAWLLAPTPHSSRPRSHCVARPVPGHATATAHGAR